MLPAVDTTDSGYLEVLLHKTPQDYIGHPRQRQSIATGMEVILSGAR
jgi:hypothetical protein